MDGSVGTAGQMSAVVMIAIQATADPVTTEAVTVVATVP
jgi:hypothetical protein